MKLLGRFFSRYPDYVDKVVISVKGGLKGGKMSLDGFDCSYEALKEELELVKEYLKPKKLDMFQAGDTSPDTVQKSRRSKGGSLTCSVEITHSLVALIQSSKRSSS